MFALAYFFGIYSYIIFFLGLAGLLYPFLIIVVTLVVLIGGLVYFRKFFPSLGQLKTVLPFSSFSLVCLCLLLVQMGINTVGALGPEIGFDALWYHLTFPKLYLMYHALMHIPGGLLYYSDMPKLTEMLYTGALAFGADIFAKLLHLTFGILSCIVLYKIARKYLSQEFSFLTVVIFYTNLVVGWESVSAYIDLSRAFFETCTLLAFLEWRSTKNKKLFITSAILMGLALATKLVALGTLLVYSVALLIIDRDHRSLSKRLQRVSLFGIISLLIPLPWFVFSFIHTGNPLYPVFSSSFSSSTWIHLLNPLFLLQTLWTTFTHAPDPLSPIYIACIPLLFIYRKQLREYSVLLYLALGFLVTWLFLPQSGEARFLIPYLPLFSLIVGILLSLIHSLKLKAPLFIFLFVTIFISLVYRGIANTKFIPGIVGHQTKTSFLAKHLNFSYGDFYDTDGYFASHIQSSDTVLLYGFHNLYYVDFPFIDSTWIKRGDTFNYVAVQGSGLPEKFRYWNLIYFNNTTHVRLYYLKGYTWYY